MLITVVCSYESHCAVKECFWEVCQAGRNRKSTQKSIQKSSKHGVHEKETDCSVAATPTGSLSNYYFFRGSRCVNKIVLLTWPVIFLTGLGLSLFPSSSGVVSMGKRSLLDLAGNPSRADFNTRRPRRGVLLYIFEEGARLCSTNKCRIPTLFRNEVLKHVFPTGR
jgi:hypothetical protein